MVRKVRPDHEEILLDGTAQSVRYGEQDGLLLLKATETLTESVESRLNSSGTSSQDSIRCSSVVKSKIY